MLYLRNIKKKHLEVPDLEDEFDSFVSPHLSSYPHNTVGIDKVFIEDKVSGTGLIQTLRRRQSIEVVPIQRNKDRNLRVMDAINFIAMGDVLFPDPEVFDDVEWMEDYIDELLAFMLDDSHENDDQVDVTCDAVEVAIINKEVGY